MNHSSRRFEASIRGLAFVFACGLSACASKPPLEVHRPPSVWEAQFEHPVSYHKLLGDDLLVVGTTRHLYGLDPSTGGQLWRLRNINTTRADVAHVADAPYILINDASGGALDDRGTHVLAVDRRSGRILWESPVMAGRAFQAVMDRSSQRVVAAMVVEAHGDDRGFFSDLLPNKGLFSGLEREPDLVAMDLATGQPIWRRPLGEEVLMRPSHRAGVSDPNQPVRPFDLGIYHPPQLLDDQVCVSYTGLRCYRMSDGEPTWFDDFDVIDDHLGRSYPRPLLAGDVLIAGDTDRLMAFDVESGRRLWRTEKLGRVPELLDDESILFGQVGGRYFDIDNEEWDAEGPFAAVAVNKRNGNVLWDYGRIRRSISNLMVAGPFVWLADDEHLFALDRLDGSVGLRVPHKLSDPPIYVLLNESGDIVLISEEEAAGYDQDSGRLLWYHHYPAPGPGAWKRFAAGLLTVSGGFFKLSSLVIAYGSGLLPSIPNVSIANGRRVLSGKGVLENTTGYLGDKLSETGAELGEYSGFANLSGRTQYFVTQPRKMDEVVLASVDLDTGEAHTMTVLPSQSTQLVIDENSGLIFQSLGQAVVAVPLGR